MFEHLKWHGLVFSKMYVLLLLVIFWQTFLLYNWILQK